MPSRFALLPRLLLIFAASALFALGQRGAQAADTAAISVAPAAATVSAGDDVSLDGMVANVPSAPGLGGYALGLKWDPAILQLVSITDSGWVGSGAVIVLCDTAGIDNVAGTAGFGCSPIFANGPGVTTTAPHALVHAVFHAKVPGTTTIDLTGSSVMNPSNVALTGTISGGSVQVTAPSASPTPNATSTAQPTGTPATVLPSATPGAQATATPISQTPSTKPTETTLSKVEVPQTGSGTAARGGTAWRMPVLAVALAVLLAAGGAVAFRKAGKGNNGG
jgi:hypothetical protein